MADDFPASEPRSSSATRPRRWRVWLASALVVLLVGPLLVFTLWSWAALSWDFSTGQRVGYIQKFSRKGWLCKTYEGELAMVTIPGTLPQIFHFSVRDGDVAAEIERVMETGQPAALQYEQHRGVPTSCFGETEYYVTEARPVSSDRVPRPADSAAVVAPAPVSGVGAGGRPAAPARP